MMLKLRNSVVKLQLEKSFGPPSFIDDDDKVVGNVDASSSINANVDPPSSNANGDALSSLLASVTFGLLEENEKHPGQEDDQQDAVKRAEEDKEMFSMVFFKSLFPTGP
eukprot:767795-Hanusia_phi.AAC.4